VSVEQVTAFSLPTANMNVCLSNCLVWLTQGVFISYIDEVLLEWLLTQAEKCSDDADEEDRVPPRVCYQ
jgi:hypothetical protein